MQPDPAEAVHLFLSNVSNNGLIVPIDPADLKNVWKLGREMQEEHPKEHTAIDLRVLETVCSPGANVMAVWYRASMLGLLAELVGLFPPEMPEDAKNVIFKIFAQFPIKLMGPGVSQGFPLDVQEFMKQVEDELRGLGFKV
jgi:hypothetical protein